MKGAALTLGMVLLVAIVVLGGRQVYLKTLPPIEPLPNELVIFPGNNDVLSVGKVLIEMDMGKLEWVFTDQEGRIGYKFFYHNTTHQTYRALIIKQSCGTDVDLELSNSRNGFSLPLDCFSVVAIPPGEFKFEGSIGIDELRRRTARWSVQVLVIDENRDYVSSWVLLLPSFAVVA